MAIETEDVIGKEALYEEAGEIPTLPILEYLAQFQGSWTSNWHGHFVANKSHNGEPVNDVFCAMPKGTSKEASNMKMASLYVCGLVGGCPCGCRGDFEITDLGLQLIGQKRTNPYTGY